MFAAKHQLEFNAVPPYSFELTVHKPAGWWWSTPREIYEDSILWTAVRLNSRLCGLRLEATRKLSKVKATCSVFSHKAMSPNEKDKVTSTVRRALGLEEDLTEFYAMAGKDDILRQTVTDLCGMRTLDWPDLFPALILAVTLQMAPMKRSNQMMDLLIDNFGEKITFDDKTILHWPSPEKIAKLSLKELKEKAKLGYRAKSLISIAKTLQQGFPTEDELTAMPPDEAKKQLMSLRGIGDYSAEIVMPRPGFPLDVWSSKIFSILFTGKKPNSPREVIPELKRMAEERWGKWRGHAFVYVLNDLPKISERIGIDLTRF